MDWKELYLKSKENNKKMFEILKELEAEE